MRPEHTDKRKQFRRCHAEHAAGDALRQVNKMNAEPVTPMLAIRGVVAFRSCECRHREAGDVV